MAGGRRIWRRFGAGEDHGVPLLRGWWPGTSSLCGNGHRMHPGGDEMRSACKMKSGVFVTSLSTGG